MIIQRHNKGTRHRSRPVADAKPTTGASRSGLPPSTTFTLRVEAAASDHYYAVELKAREAVELAAYTARMLTQDWTILGGERASGADCLRQLADALDRGEMFV